MGEGELAFSKDEPSLLKSGQYNVYTYMYITITKKKVYQLESQKDKSGVGQNVGRAGGRKGRWSDIILFQLKYVLESSRGYRDGQVSK